MNRIAPNSKSTTIRPLASSRFTSSSHEFIRATLASDSNCAQTTIEYQSHIDNHEPPNTPNRHYPQSWTYLHPFEPRDFNSVASSTATSPIEQRKSTWNCLPISSRVLLLPKPQIIEITTRDLICFESTLFWIFEFVNLIRNWIHEIERFGKRNRTLIFWFTFGWVWALVYRFCWALIWAGPVL